ncbi:transglutaminaseTgpA domain-containing protein [Glaciecola sp. 1036]|uniref:transglutaminase family protein n=1 Tax=Alteromonadaceae TaxID=72275 RepID=UPI003D067A0E
MVTILSQKALKLPSILSAILFTMVLAPLYEPMMGWVWVLFVCANLICLARAFKPIPALKNRTLNVFALFCLVLLITFAGEYGLLSTMVNLLVVACSLKFLMLKTTADFHLVLIVQIFLIASGFIFHQGLGFALYYSIAVFLVFYIAFLLNMGNQTSTDAAKQTAKQLAQAIPIAALVFIIAPRFPPFWETPVEKKNETGLSEKITPGDIANLARSTDLVFRAEFTGDIPEPGDRYWRAIILDYFDGQSWSVGPQQSVQVQQQSVNYFGDFWRYLVIAEPNQTRWLYSLDIPLVTDVMSQQEINQTDNYQLFTSTPAKNNSLYIVNSYYQMPLDRQKVQHNFERYLQLPSSGNPETKKYIESLALDSLSNFEKMHKIAEIFTPESFKYTLKPPLMQNEPVDQFLFSYRRGFCSHYASALTYMLRLAGVPSRIVTGYQGGLEQATSILTVRQYDAHAWVEAWQEDIGWVRIDPTAMVAPDRMTTGLLSAISEEDNELVEGNSFLRGMASLPGLKHLSDFIVMANHNWSQMVLGYDQENQRDLIERIFGEVNTKNLITFLLVSFAIIVAIVAFFFAPWRRWFKTEKVTPQVILFEILRNRGFNKQTQETMKDFFVRISDKCTEDEKQVLFTFADVYYEFEYADVALQAPNQKRLDEALEECIKIIKPK